MAFAFAQLDANQSTGAAGEHYCQAPDKIGVRQDDVDGGHGVGRDILSQEPAVDS